MGEDRLRVLRVYHSGVVGAWRERDRRLRDLGIDVTLVAPRRWNEGGRDVVLDPAADAFVEPARTLGRHPYTFVYDPRPLWRVLRSRDFDVVDIHEEPASMAVAEVLALMWLARRRGAVCLYSAQNIAKRYPPPFRWIERVALRRVAAVHTCNDAAGRILRTKGFRGTVCNLGLGVDVARFAPHADADADDGERARGASGSRGQHDAHLRLGYVGRLEAHKGVDVVLRAVAALPGVTLEIVGDGPERDTLVSMIERLGLGARVSITGFVTAADLPAVYGSFDAVVVPSLDTPSWVEQFGRVAVEAMASGVCVVASDSGSLPEVVGDAGVLVRPGDAASLAEALRALAVDRDELQRLGRQGRERAMRWSWSAIAERQRDLYEAISSNVAQSRHAG